MTVHVYIPTSLRPLTGNCSTIDAPAGRVADVLAGLTTRFPAIRERLYDEQGRLHRHVSIFVNDAEIGQLQGIETPVRDGDHVAVIPAIAGGAVDLGIDFSQRPLTWGPEQVQRYSRHLILPEIGGVGQKKLLRSRVLLVGAGGLGSPIALYLAAAGVGTIGLIDFDDVDMSNLQRQILHRTSTVGIPKVESGKRAINDLNPDVNVITHRVPINSENAMEVIPQYDIVVNGCDNFPTRYLVNDACYLLNKPLVDGSIFRFEGQATVYLPGRGCYRCVFPAPPPAGAVPSCAEAGVLGVLPGIIGVIQAIETIKLIVGIGEPLVNRLLLFDALEMSFRQVKLRRNPNCPLCGDNPTIHQLIDYEDFCGVAIPSAPAPASA
ncbi:MAG: molybdopterin-synthase adenylyltransferase MoeB [Chloroflexota bacterium]|nr:molybdopterin-synthase adenylyltransferase MoeB [Dehalococcoidia bacterium]MDW8254242.1 molybdopterin-synthase adenylyltransferase MoeB [Chloroflexota bacterium]